MLSPCLFNFYTDIIFRHMEGSKGVTIGGTRINSLRYAGDNVLLADSEEMVSLHAVKTNPAESARNLGVIFDTNFTFRSHVSVVCSSCFCHMWDLRRIRRHLDLDSAKLLATALVASRLDYCNSLLYGIADIDLTRLQACTESTDPPGDKVSSIYLQYSTASFSSLGASKV